MPIKSKLKTRVFRESNGVRIATTWQRERARGETRIVRRESNGNIISDTHAPFTTVFDVPERTDWGTDVWYYQQEIYQDGLLIGEFDVFEWGEGHVILDGDNDKWWVELKDDKWCILKLVEW